MQKHLRGLATVFALALAMSTPLSTYARAGSSSSTAKTSSPKAAPAKPASVSKSADAAPKGMTRKTVMEEARSQSPRNQPSQQAAAPAQQAGGQQQPYYNGNQPAQQGKRYSGTQLAGAAAAGAVAGYMLHGATSPNTTVVNSGSVAPGYVNDGPSAGFNSGGTPMSSSSSGLGTGVVFLLMALLIGGALLFAFRRTMGGSAGNVGNSTAKPYASFGGASAFAPANTNVASSAFSAEEGIKRELLQQAKDTFRKVQDANNREDAEAMASVVDDSYLPALTADFGQRDTPSATRVHSVKVVNDRILGFERQDERYVGSVHFLADLSEGSAPSEEVEEVWHFVRAIDGGRWLLAGIEQV